MNNVKYINICDNPYLKNMICYCFIMPSVKTSKETYEDFIISYTF